MKSPIIRMITALVALLAVMSMPARGERVSLKLSYSTNGISGNDINTWIDSFNLLWQDYRNASGGSLQGQFVPVNFSNGLEIELRIPLYKGLAINLAGSWLSASEEGTVSFQLAGTGQSEEQYLLNKVSAVPLKIGFSYAFALPPFPRLSLLAGLGRHIVFAKYESTNNQHLRFPGGYQYWIERDNAYRSESLGFYAHLGAELELLRFMAVVVEAEQVWNTTDGFKGSYTYLYKDEGFQETLPPFTQTGNASLYFYESDTLETGTFYDTLGGHQNRPGEQLDVPFAGNWPEDGSYRGFPVAGPRIKNIRQGELDFSHVSFKIGFRFKF